MLEGEGFEVDAVASAEEGMVSFDRRQSALALIDLMLPGMSGLEAARHIRANSDIPIIIVSARDDTQDVIDGLEAGADDYVKKPFVPSELLARIRAHLRRRPQTSEAFSVGELRVLPEAGTVQRANGEEVHLTTTEFRLLSQLAAHAGKVLSREHLLEHVWGYDYFGDGRLVDVHLRRLRTKVEPDPANPVHIVTVRGAGYKMVL